jgi:RNA polymerase sigma-70 factor (ECF subfamily)
MSMRGPAQEQDEGGVPESSPTLTSSLLVRLNAQEQEAWRRIVHLYYPVVCGWCKRSGLKDDAADVAQEVFLAVASGVGRFRREGGKNSFRGWLWGITRFRLKAYRRRQKEVPAVGGTDAWQRIEQMPEELPEEPPEDRETSRSRTLRRALEQLRQGVQEHTWQAFWRVVVEGQPPAGVAADLGIKLHQIYVIKARLLRKLREEFGEILD